MESNVAEPESRPQPESDAAPTRNMMFNMKIINN
jgi:hypothetical protein